MPVAGAMFFAVSAGGVVFAWFARRVVPVLGESRLSAMATAVIALSVLGIAWTPWLGAAPLTCFGAGLGFYMLHNTLQTNATQMAPERRGAAVALFASLFFLGQSAGVALAGRLAEATGNENAELKREREKLQTTVRALREQLEKLTGEDDENISTKNGRRK